MAESRLRFHVSEYLVKAEVAIYSILAVLLSVTALAAIVTAGKLLWGDLARLTIAACCQGREGRLNQRVGRPPLERQKITHSTVEQIQQVSGWP